MFSCDKCEKVFAFKHGLVRHLKSHDGIRFRCYLCPSIFSDKWALSRHVKTIHHLVKYGVDYNIAIGNHADSRAMSMSENVSVVERMQVGPSAISPKRRKQCNTDNTIKSKRLKVKRLLDITTSGFHKTGESLNSQILWFYKKYIENIVGYQA
ncbi:putative transcription factor Ovo-like 1 [Daktulosphaira vitifoliae]|uniref:putative transcription factor Ovo-like 1 n=1 Tax=Daktulosphaira vitifoliae TaxID=58002 RepID=UPI0021A9E047|nr:putative transcription factor Ovo-like 1 [Daktulosphaira vitifoliae]